jgi:hypothetical protein
MACNTITELPPCQITVLLEKLIVAQLVKKYIFYWIKGLLRLSEESATGHHERDESSQIYIPCFFKRRARGSVVG